MSLEKKFDIWDIITLVKIYLPKLFIFTIFYFFLIYFIDTKLKNSLKEHKFLDVEISITKLDKLPKHYLNLDNIIDYDEKFNIQKKNILKKYLLDNRHLTNFMKNHRIHENNRDDSIRFFRESDLKSINSEIIILQINNHAYYKDLDSKTIDRFLDKMNLDVYKEILDISKNFNETLMFFENILKQLDNTNLVNYSFNNKPLHSFNENIIDNYKKNNFSRIFRVSNIEEKIIIENPYNIFNQIKLYIFYVVTYVVALLMIVIFLYSFGLSQPKLKIK